MKNLTTILFLCFIIEITVPGCKKEKYTPTNIVLYDKPLETIQLYIQGKWKLQYAYGGLSTHKYIDRYNSYMILSSDHIIIGNDSTGIVVDTNITWVRAEIGYTDSTYLLSYSWKGYLWPEHYVVDQIKCDTLMIREYVSDSYTYYYTKY